MNIAGYAAAPAHVALPPQKAGRRARLPTVAIALARYAVGEIILPAHAAIYFGTAYGDATETEAFVENMILNHEEFPKPRAFAASVHNAMASRVAMAHPPGLCCGSGSARQDQSPTVGRYDQYPTIHRSSHQMPGL